MPWIKLTDDWYDDRKIKAAGPIGVAMWTVGLSWCGRNLTDGFIPTEQIDCLLSWRGIAWKIGGGEIVDADTVARHLVQCELWEHVVGGYQVRNYLKYQPSAQQVIAEREKERARWQERKTSRSKQTPGGVPAESDQTPSYPVPVPVPGSRTTKHSSSSSSFLQGVAGPRGDEKLIEAALGLYGERMLSRQPNGSVRSPTQWKRKAIDNARDELSSQVADWIERYDVTASQIADALIEGSVPASWSTCRRSA